MALPVDIDFNAAAAGADVTTYTEDGETIARIGAFTETTLATGRVRAAASGTDAQPHFLSSSQFTASEGDVLGVFEFLSAAGTGAVIIGLDTAAGRGWLAEFNGSTLQWNTFNAGTYSAFGPSASVSGIVAGDTYRIRATMRNGSGGSVVLSAYIARGTDAFASSPTVTMTVAAADVPASRRKFGWSLRSTGSAITDTNGTQLTQLLASDPASTTPIPGVVTRTARATSTLSFSMTAATGGTSIAYQWHRSTGAGFTPVAGTAISGATGLTLTDTPPDDGTYWYKAVVTNAEGGTATTNEVPGRTLPKAVTLILCGDSNVEAFSQFGQYIVSKLQQWDASLDIAYSNQGHSGHTSAEWVSGSADLTAALSAASTAVTAGRRVVFVLMIGTNDAKTGQMTSAAAYGTNVGSFSTAVTGAGYPVALVYPPYVVPAGAWDTASNALLLSYQAQIDLLTNGETIVAGGRQMLSETAMHTDELVDGVHFTTAGGQRAGFLVARAVQGMVTPASAGSAGSGLTMADVQTALTNQGYTTTRAPLLDNINATVSSRAAPGAAMTLTTGERTAVANEVEAQIIDDTDSERVLTAITDKIAAANPSLNGLTLAAIASAARDALLAGAAANSMGAALSTLLTRLPAGYGVAVGGGTAGGGSILLFGDLDRLSSSLAVVNLTQNDAGRPLQEFLRGPDGHPVDLTGKTVAFHLRASGATAAQVSAAATVEYAPLGLVEYVLSAANLAQTGRFRGEWQVTSAAGIETFPAFGGRVLTIGVELA